MQGIVSGCCLHCGHFMTFMTAGHTKLGEIKESLGIMGVVSSYVARIFPTLVDVYSVGVRARSHMT